MASTIETPEVEVEVFSIKESKIITEMRQETRGNITEQAAVSLDPKDYEL